MATSSAAPVDNASIGPFPAASFGAFGLAAGRVAAAVLAAASRRQVKQVVVLGERLGRAVARAGLPTLIVAERPRARRKGPPAVAGRLDALPLADGVADVVVMAGLPKDALASLGALARIASDGGLVVIATPSASSLARRATSPADLAAAFVHAALLDVEQRVVGGVRLTTGRVRRAVLDPAR